MPLQRVIFKASEAEIAAWKEAAWISRKTFSAWIRERCNDVTLFESSNGKVAEISLVDGHFSVNDSDS